MFWNHAAEEHDCLHFDGEDSVLGEELTQKRDLEGLEDMIKITSIGTGERNMRVLKTRLKVLLHLGLKLNSDT